MYNIFIIKTDGSVVHTTQPKAPDLAQWQAACGGGDVLFYAKEPKS